MPDPFVSALGAMYSSVLAETITYVPASGDPLPDLSAIRGVIEAGDGNFSGPAKMGTTFEVQRSDVAAKPTPGAKITAADGDWFIKSVMSDAPDTVWRCVVEQRGVA